MWTIAKYTIPIVVAVLIIGAYRIGNSRGVASVDPVVETIYRDRDIARRDTTRGQAEPVTIIKYRTVEIEKTRVDTLRIPINMNVAGVVSANPVVIRNRRVGLTTYDVGEQQFVQRFYEVPPKRFQWYIFPSVSNSTASLSAGVTFKNVGISIGTIQSYDGQNFAYHAGIGYKLSNH